MRTNYSIKNFRTFNQGGALFKLSPITFLTGCNSSGKSSIVKSLMLLDDFLSQLKSDVRDGVPINLDNYKLDFSKKRNKLLGNFSKVLNWDDSSNSFELSYSIHSLYLSEEVTVSLEFKAIEHDVLSNGHLERITVYNGKNEIIFSFGRNYNVPSTIGSNDYKVNLNYIKENFIQFSELEYMIHHYCVSYCGNDIFGSLTDTEFEEIRSKTKSKLNEFSQAKGKNVILDCVMAGRKNSSQPLLLEDNNDSLDVLLKAKETGTFFYTPIWDWLKNSNKETLRNTLSEKYEGGVPFIVEKVVADFESSKFESFSDYFLSKENSYYSEIKPSKIHRNFSSITLFDVSDMVIEQSYQYITDMVPNEIKGESVNELGTVSNDDIDKWRSKEVDFSILYQALINICEKYSQNDNKYYTLINTSGFYFDTYQHRMNKMLGLFAEKVLREVLTPDFTGNIIYVGSSRIKVERLYALENRDDFSNVVLDYFSAKREHLRTNENVNFSQKQYEPDSFINYWIQKFDVGHHISLVADEDGLGVKIYIHNSEGDVKGHLLAEEGYGITQLVSILLQIEACILGAKGLKIHDVIGLSHIDHFDLNSFHYEVQTIAIEEPEIHLHPRYQSLLADMFLEANEKYNIDFIIETHSEYLIRRSQVLVASRKYSNEEDLELNNPFKVYYLSKADAAYDMLYKINGKFIHAFGPGFFDEADNAAMELFDIENS